jgi:hypothetical protein
MDYDESEHSLSELIVGNKTEKASRRSTVAINAGASASLFYDGADTSSGRFNVVDPALSGFDRMRRPPLPAQEVPDWMFQPNADKPVGLGLATRMTAERERRASLPNLLQRNNTSATTTTAAASLETDSPKSKLFHVLNLDPWNDKDTYDDALAYDVIKKHPKALVKKMAFESTKDKIYPFSMLCALGASAKTLGAAYRAHPPAAAANDAWIGTPLHYACHYRAPLATLRFLLEQVTLQNKNGTDSSDSSSSSSDDSTSSDDSSNGACEMIRATNQMIRLPIHVACMSLMPCECLQLLILHFKAGLQRVDKDGYTPLHLACDHADVPLPVIELLTLKYRAAALTQSKVEKSTPMHLAVTRGCALAVVEALFLSQPDTILSVTDASGNLPIHAAVQSRAHVNVIQFLVWNHSEGLATVNNKFDRPIDIARRKFKRDKDLQEILEPYG